MQINMTIAIMIYNTNGRQPSMRLSKTNFDLLIVKMFIIFASTYVAMSNVPCYRQIEGHPSFENFTLVRTRARMIELTAFNSAHQTD